MPNKKIKIVAIIIFLMLPINYSWAETILVEKTTTLELALHKESFFAPSLELAIVINPGGQSFNAIQAEIKFDPTALELVSIEPNPNMGWLLATSSINNVLGLANITCGTTTPILSDSITAAKITFKKLSTGFTELAFTDNSQVAAANGLGTNILLSSEVHNIYLVK